MKKSILSVLFVCSLYATSSYAAPVNINQASADEIASALTGVGASKANAIVEYRNQYGQFKQAGEIVQVRGIGSSIYEQNKSDILVK